MICLCKYVTNEQELLTCLYGSFYLATIFWTYYSRYYATEEDETAAWHKEREPDESVVQERGTRMMQWLATQLEANRHCRRHS